VRVRRFPQIIIYIVFSINIANLPAVRVRRFLKKTDRMIVYKLLSS
jgi:hypothetical protein